MKVEEAKKDGISSGWGIKKDDYKEEKVEEKPKLGEKEEVS